MSIEELACKAACHDLMMTFGAALDRGAHQEAADQFTDDGVIAGPNGEVSGPAMRAFLARRSPDIATHHILSNVLVRPIDAALAEARAYLMVYRTSAGAAPRPLPPTPAVVGEVNMQFRKTTMGWRISRFDAITVLQATG